MDLRKGCRDSTDANDLQGGIDMFVARHKLRRSLQKMPKQTSPSIAKEDGQRKCTERALVPMTKQVIDMSIAETGIDCAKANCKSRRSPRRHRQRRSRP